MPKTCNICRQEHPEGQSDNIYICVRNLGNRLIRYETYLSIAAGLNDKEKIRFCTSEDVQVAAIALLSFCMNNKIPVADLRTTKEQIQHEIKVDERDQADPPTCWRCGGLHPAGRENDLKICLSILRRCVADYHVAVVSAFYVLADHFVLDGPVQEIEKAMAIEHFKREFFRICAGLNVAKNTLPGIALGSRAIEAEVPSGNVH